MKHAALQTKDLQTKEEVASKSLTVIPIQEHDFALTKSEFRDLL